ncbi:MAG: hypothetical protein MZW92_47990 [Comamonadaceae bacterium]|nr:hypothetical protein [Comamonadaceae bacterium]
MALLPFPLMALALLGDLAPRARCLARSRSTASRQLNEHVQETVAGVRTLRALGLEARAPARVRAARAGRRRRQLRRADAGRPRTSRRSACTLTAATVLTLGVGGWLVWQRRDDGGPADRVHDVPRPADLADVRRRAGCCR